MMKLGIEVTVGENSMLSTTTEKNSSRPRKRCFSSTYAAIDEKITCSPVPAVVTNTVLNR